MRGAMLFEDFNYNTFNKYILVDTDNQNYEDITFETKEDGQDKKEKNQKFDIADLL